MSKKVVKKLSKVVKMLSKSCQKLSKSCQKNVKLVNKLSKFKTSGEDDEEEDWWLLVKITIYVCLRAKILYELMTSF
jgi:hypothetical protein